MTLKLKFKDSDNISIRKASDYFIVRFNKIQMDNYEYNDRLFEILDVADSNCSSSLVESLNHLVTMAQDEPSEWKKITGNCILKSKVNSSRHFYVKI